MNQLSCSGNSGTKRGVHVAVATGLVALAANVNLERRQVRPAQCKIVAGEFFFEAVHLKCSVEGWSSLKASI
ncbi:MAG: hypothetical protein HYY24_23740 [Verrucomicrobia bacterium]|nr:hypothetical protein [Verrucomicrobiota bacterium]